MDLNTLLFFRRFRFQVIARLVLIAATFVICFLGYQRFNNYVWLLGGGLVIVWQTHVLLSKVERITRDLTSFLEAIQFSDFTQSFRSPFQDKIFKSLYEGFSNVMYSFQETRSLSETQRRYFETLVHHVGIGLLCFHPDGTVALINNAAKRLLDRPALLNIHDLKSLSPSLLEALLSMGSGDQHLVRVDVGSEQLKISLYATRFTLQNDEFMLVSLQNIGTELEDSEMEAMQHMTRVLAHEIMNSMTPIVSLASLAQHQLSSYAATPSEEPDEEDIEDLRDALTTIEKRSEGLLHFVNAYRSITRIPQPDVRLFQVKELLNRVVHLFDAHMNAAGITVRQEVDPATLAVLADPDLIEQVLINLVKNAIEAFDDQPYKEIVLEGMLDKLGRVVIRVTDNGPGIPEEVIENIFVPFFSTKSNGSGIGLSFSRHVMRRHQGTLYLQSKEGGPTTFTLRF